MSVMTRYAVKRWPLTILAAVLLATAAPVTAEARLGQRSVAALKKLNPLPAIKRALARRRPAIATGVVAGRFQVLHKDHMKYILAAKKQCRHLVVGITNPDPSLTRADAADLKRSKPQNNPLSYYERQVMVTGALKSAGLKPSKDFSVVPLPINYPDKYKHYLPKGATCFVTVYDGWGDRKAQQFKDQGFSTTVLWKRPQTQKGISATQVRERMVAGQPWEHMVPRSVARDLKAWDVPRRLQQMSAGQLSD